MKSNIFFLLLRKYYYYYFFVIYIFHVYTLCLAYFKNNLISLIRQFPHTYEFTVQL
jgi:hypothetical protein